MNAVACHVQSKKQSATQKYNYILNYAMKSGKSIRICI